MCHWNEILFCLVLTDLICREMLPGDEWSNIVAFTEIWSYDADLVAIILVLAYIQRARFRHYLNPFEISIGIQLCPRHLAGTVI